MKLRSWIRSLLTNVLRRRKVERQLDEELQSYVEMVTDAKMAIGVLPPEARRTTLAEFGGIEQVKQTVRDGRSGASFELLCRDLIFGLRQLLRNPGFTVTVAVTLALSIGANTAIFSLVNALMLKNLPYPQPNRLGTIFWNVGGPKPGNGPHRITEEQWELLRDDVPSLQSAVASGRADGENLQAGERAEYVHTGRISAQYLNVLAPQGIGA